jgi:hypothetical protein
MAIEEVRRGWYIDSKEFEDPKCIRVEQFESKTFHDFMLPRLESARDEASAEVLEGLRRGRSLGDAIFDAIESLPASKTKRLRSWVELAKGTHIYAFVEFTGGDRSHLTYGLVRTTGGPKDAIIDRKEIGGWEFAGAPYWEFYDAYKAIDASLSRESRHSERQRISYLFADNPMVEVREEGDYEDALKLMGLSPKASGWKGPGLYDFRDSPPSYSGSLRDYARETMKSEAERALQDMWISESWEAACEILVERANR